MTTVVAKETPAPQAAVKGLKGVIAADSAICEVDGLEGRLILACRPADGHPAVRRPDPDPLMGQEEGHTDANHHQGTAEPYHPHTRIFGHLQPGKKFLIGPLIGEDLFSAAVFIELGKLLEKNDLLGSAAGGSNRNLCRRARSDGQTATGWPGIAAPATGRRRSVWRRISPRSWPPIPALPSWRRRPPTRRSSSAWQKSGIAASPRVTEGGDVVDIDAEAERRSGHCQNSRR